MACKRSRLSLSCNLFTVCTLKSLISPSSEYVTKGEKLLFEMGCLPFCPHFFYVYLFFICFNCSKAIPENKGRFLQFDDILKSIGEFGFWQKIIYLLTCIFVNVPTTFQLVGVFFISGTPKFQCATPSVECDANKCCDNCTKYDFYQFTSTTTEVGVLDSVT